MRCIRGHLLEADAPEGLCPQCLAALAFSTPARIGPFAVLGTLGQGGFGVVYRARHASATCDVALKVPRGLELADPQRLAEFWREPTLSAKLSSEHVVRVLEVGEQAGVPYFTMEYMAGGTLRSRMARYRESPERAVELMIRIAAAVQYLHHDPEHPEREPILHRDLKPENILFGADDTPRLSDFGIAKLAKGPTWTVDTRPAGCPAYMAPEQAFPSRRRELTAGVDVYALGAILYELFTGRPPFEGTDAQILARLESAFPVSPRRFAPHLDPLLERVVLCALQKDPAFRYRSAAGFAQDLARALRKKPPELMPVIPSATRLRTWMRRHPLRAAAAAWLLSLVCVLAMGARSAIQGRAQRLEQAQQTNAAIAGMQAVAVNLQLKAYEQRIAQLSRDPSVVALADSNMPGTPSALLQARLGPFDTLFVMGLDARQRARTTQKTPEYLARSFGFRDYFKGAAALATAVCSASGAGAPEAAYLARAFRSESDGHFEFALSAPLCRNSTWIGVLGGTIGTDAVLGAVRLLDDHNGRITAVLGPRDRERHAADLPLPDDLTFIVHPGLVKGQAQHLTRPEPALIRQALGISRDGARNAHFDRLRYAAPLRLDDYRDPTPGYEGAWSAVFAAADESGYVVTVASRHSEPSLARLMLEELSPAAGLPFALSLALLIAARLERLRRGARDDRGRS